MSITARLGRPMLSAIFITGGIDQLLDPDPKTGAAEKVRDDIEEQVEGESPLPSDPTQLVQINGAVQVVAGTLFAVGRMPRLASAALAVSLVGTTFGAHRFWEADDDERDAQQIQFLKNLGLLGGLLIALGDTGGRPSVSWRARRSLTSAKDDAADALTGLTDIDLHLGGA